MLTWYHVRVCSLFFLLFPLKNKVNDILGLSAAEKEANYLSLKSVLIRTIVWMSLNGNWFEHKVASVLDVEPLFLY